MKYQFTKEELVNAIKHIDNNPELIKGRHSSTYDLIYGGKEYPPILVLSVANELKGGQSLTLADFSNNTDVPFKILRDYDFEVELKSSQIMINLNEFINVADEQNTGEGTTEAAARYLRENKGVFNGLKIDISFGIGRASAIPWIAFTGFDQTVKKGIYPVYLYYKEYKILILAYGVSETNRSDLNWDNSNNFQSISNYFEKRFSKKPDRYGNSYIFKVYETSDMPAKEILVSDLSKLIKDYKKQFEKKPNISSIKNPIHIENFKVDVFQEHVKESGLVISKLLFLRFVSSLLTKPFVILSGLSGSGKTKLAQAFVQWICHEDSQYRIIPVGADWTNREPLLGYPNALKQDEYVKPDSGVIDLIIQANNNPELPHFLILDEMNLSHVERYFADFLSVMESKEEIPLYDPNSLKKGVPPKLKVPSNLFIIGTVNIDETTNMFSPKVLDRANTIEFRVTQDEMQNFLSNIKEINMDALTSKGAEMAKSFLDMAANKSFESKDLISVNEALLKFFDELKKIGAEFGYRSATEILRLINQLTVLDNNLTSDEKLDIAIIQKLLPKLHGSRRKLIPILKTLGFFCLKEDINVIKDVFENKEFDFEKDTKVKYRLSLEKIARMYNGAIDNGFASFAEA